MLLQVPAGVTTSPPRCTCGAVQGQNPGGRGSNKSPRIGQSPGGAHAPGQAAKSPSTPKSSARTGGATTPKTPSIRQGDTIPTPAKVMW